MLVNEVHAPLLPPENPHLSAHPKSGCLLCHGFAALCNFGFSEVALALEEPLIFLEEISPRRTDPNQTSRNSSSLARAGRGGGCFTLFNAPQTQECRHKCTCSMHRARRRQRDGSDARAPRVPGDETFPFTPFLFTPEERVMRTYLNQPLRKVKHPHQGRLQI